jgi:hypothetical protein
VIFIIIIITIIIIIIIIIILLLLSSTHWLRVRSTWTVLGEMRSVPVRGGSISPPSPPSSSASSASVAGRYSTGKGIMIVSR